MPSFDIVNKVDTQELDNAVNMTKKVISTRYDFRKSKTEIALNKKEKKIHIVTEDEMKMKAVHSELVGNLVRRKIDQKTLSYGEIEPTSKGMLKQGVDIKEGIDVDTARKIVKTVKGMKLKVQAQIQDQQVRVTGKKIDDLQTVIATLKQQELDVPLQFVNLKN
jgi:uncharacterized protein YajQ (UPF0234 family)